MSALQQNLLDPSMVVADTTTDDRYTPLPVVKRVAAFWPEGIDLDPSWNPNSLIRARRTFTIEEDGLAHPWWDESSSRPLRVWCNPPWSDPLQWALRARIAYQKHRSQVLFLCKLDTSTKWFQHLWHATQLCFLGRVRYLNADGSLMGTPQFESVLGHFGDELDRFKSAFEPLGKVLVR